MPRHVNHYDEWMKPIHLKLERLNFLGEVHYRKNVDSYDWRIIDMYDNNKVIDSGVNLITLKDAKQQVWDCISAHLEALARIFAG